MKNRIATRRKLKYVDEPAPTESLTPYLHRWLDVFELSVRDENYTDASNLFAKAATGFWMGNRAIDLATLTENFKKVGFGEFHNFALDTANATIIPRERSFVLTVPWNSKSRIILGRDKSGFATFVLRFFEKNLLCLHVHFS